MKFFEDEISLFQDLLGVGNVVTLTHENLYYGPVQFLYVGTEFPCNDHVSGASELGMGYTTPYFKHEGKVKEKFMKCLKLRISKIFLPYLSIEENWKVDGELRTKEGLNSSTLKEKFDALKFETWIPVRSRWTAFPEYAYYKNASRDGKVNDKFCPESWTNKSLLRQIKALKDFNESWPGAWVFEPPERLVTHKKFGYNLFIR